MAKTKQQKEDILKGLKETLTASKTMVFVSQTGLSVNNSNTLRRKLQAEDVLYTLTKKTLLDIALESNGLKADMSLLDGQVAVAFGTDKISPARVVNTFSKEHKGMVKIVGGIYEGEFKDANFMNMIATIPSREVLLAQFVNLINSPIQRFAVAINAIADKNK